MRRAKPTRSPATMRCRTMARSPKFALYRETLQTTGCDVGRIVNRNDRVCDDACPASPASFWHCIEFRGAPECVFLGMAESFDPMWPKSKPKTKPKPWGGAAPPPAGRPLAQVQERAGRITPSSSFSMSSDRLILDRVARQHCPSPLHRYAQANMSFLPPPLKVTFLLCGRG